MSRRLAVVFCVIFLVSPITGSGGESDNEAPLSGFVCRTVPDQSLAVVSPLSGVFHEGAKIRFYDDSGNLCGTGTVKSAYIDLAYVALDNTRPGCLKRGFIASAGMPDNEIKMLCGYSLNLPMVMEKGGGGRAVPPNVVTIRHDRSATSPVYFRHANHEMACQKCHHHDVDTPCGTCHVLAADGSNKLEKCLREVCNSCHGKLEGKPSECTWCHKNGPPPSPPVAPSPR